MRIVAQRVSSSRVSVGGEVKGEISGGLCILVGVADGDTEKDAKIVAGKIARLRIFAAPGDETEKMDKSLLDIGGEALVISQFTLYADCRKGRRPSFSEAAPPERGKKIYETFIECLEALGVKTARGVFGAAMKVEIINEGPVTITLDSGEM
ncbi:D-aminoacyl-tRNA deacylase [Synergistales bacterium]|nr:D-aminoacyl-tRNA deacylase [Synergistales bacterium]